MSSFVFLVMGDRFAEPHLTRFDTNCVICDFFIVVMVTTDTQS